jgi:hypothetical protein
MLPRRPVFFVLIAAAMFAAAAFAQPGQASAAGEDAPASLLSSIQTQLPEGAVVQEPDRQVVSCYEAALQELRQSMLAAKRFPLGTRMGWWRQALEIFELQNKPDEAIRFSLATLIIIGDKRRTAPEAGLSPLFTQGQRASVWRDFARDVTEAEATIHEKIAELREQTGEAQEAEKHRRRARELRARGEPDGWVHPRRPTSR